MIRKIHLVTYQFLSARDTVKRPHDIGLIEII